MKTNIARKQLLVGGVLCAVAAAGIGRSALATGNHATHSKITSAQASAIVLKRFPGKLTAKTGLENEEGKWQYSVMVRSGHTLREVMVGAYTGKIEDIEVTSSGKENVEAKAEVKADAKAKMHAVKHVK